MELTHRSLWKAYSTANLKPTFDMSAVISPQILDRRSDVFAINPLSISDRRPTESASPSCSLFFVHRDEYFVIHLPTAPFNGMNLPVRAYFLSPLGRNTQNRMYHY